MRRQLLPCRARPSGLPRAKRAIVIGAGPAGTSAAFRLSKAGCAVRLIECDVEVGGRTRSRRQDGFIMDIAAGLMPSTYTAVYRLMDDAGLKDMLAARSMLTTRAIGFASKLKLLRAGLTAMAMWSSLGFENLGHSGRFDTPDESLGGYARRVLNDELLEYLINPMQKLMYVMSADRASVVDLFWSAKNLFADDAYCVKGGMGRIVECIADQLEVTLGTEVVSVEESGESVAVTMRDSLGCESTGITCGDKVGIANFETTHNAQHGARRPGKLSRGIIENGWHPAGP